ncbi:MAG: carbohydrate binding domain-containing protein [Planctomycetota bacterium]
MTDKRWNRTVMLAVAGVAAGLSNAQSPIEFGFLWHMHQPVYVPYLTPPQVDAAGLFSFSVQGVHNNRIGPYRAWPRNAIQAGLGQPNLGAQVSFSGSLIENLDAMEAVAPFNWTNWESEYRQARAWNTTLGNERLDLVGFGYHHPLMPLLDERDIRMQIRLHRAKQLGTFGGPASRGIFPPETAFHKRIIPALQAEGIEWALVDSIHFDRASAGFPHSDASGIARPNRADQVNPDPSLNGGAWVSLQNLWAPTQVSAPFSYRPAWVEWVDPEADPANLQATDVSSIIAVPAARYEGNEDGRGGYGAFLYEQVMDQYRHLNTDPSRPMFVMLHHDGDNFGGGSDGYYNANFQNMVNWVSSTPNYNATTVDDYLQRFPVPSGEVIHVEPGSWAGADAGDPEFKRWLGDPGPDGWSPDRNSWAVLTAAKNVVFTAEDLMGPENTSPDAIIAGTGDAVERAWRFLLAAQSSDHWYWDGTEVWDSNVTVGSNQALDHAWPVVANAIGNEPTPPTVFLPQREPYNPGGDEFGVTMPSDFEVWTFVDDVSGVSNVTLKWRVDTDGVNDPLTFENETYIGGPSVGAWNSEVMASTALPPRPAYVEAPTRIATRYAATISDQQDVLIDYYVEATDAVGNVQRTDIQHVWVGSASTGGGGGAGAVEVVPDPPVAGELVTIEYDASSGPISSALQVFAHVGINGWSPVIAEGLAMSDADNDGVWTTSITLPSDTTVLDVVFNDGAGTWDNNAGADWHFDATGGSGPAFVLDGELDEGAIEVSLGAVDLWAAIRGTELYVATNTPSGDRDRFIFVAGAPGTMVPSPWAKAGQVARWDAFLAGESTNDYAGWFDAAGGTQLARGSVLEGVIDLASELGGVPATIALAVGSYATNDGGALDPTQQVPQSLDGDGQLDSDEYAVIDTCLLGLGGCCFGDFDGDSIVTFFDLLAYLEAYDAGLTSADFAAPFGQLDESDVEAFLVSMEQGCP